MEKGVLKWFTWGMKWGSEHRGRSPPPGHHRRPATPDLLFWLSLLGGWISPLSLFLRKASENNSPWACTKLFALSINVLGNVCFFLHFEALLAPLSPNTDYRCRVMWALPYFWRDVICLPVGSKDFFFFWFKGFLSLKSSKFASIGSVHHLYPLLMGPGLSTCLMCFLIARSRVRIPFFLFLFIFIYLVALGLSCGSRAPQLRLAGSLVVAFELLVSACVWDLVPWPGIEPGPPALGVRSLNHCATREVPGFCF